MKTIFTNFRKTSQLFLLIALVFSINYSEAQIKHTVQVTSNVFTPDELQISAGDTVEWINSEGFHNVNGSQGTFPDNPESFGNSTGNGWTYSYVFNTAGNYDYRCDPHYTLGMTGKIEVAGNDEEKGHLIVNFSGMDPHIGQTLYISVQDKESGKEIERKQEDIGAEFSVSISGIETAHSYNVKFFADHNGNGSYDAPPTDHAWMLELDNATGTDTLNFAHNTSFTDIMWENRLTVQFTGMAPHVGQDLWLAVVDENSGMEVDRVHAVVEEEFMVHAYGIENGMSYNVDFFADFNENGSYDVPPTDHAWRLELNDVSGDTTLNFAHNTSFTDIMWKNRLTVQFTGMDPHVGQTLWLAVKEQTSGMEIGRVQATVESEFMVHVYGIENGMSYNVDFFADFNENGSYDVPPTDHAWRLELNDVAGDTTLNFAHNTNFTDIMWENRLTVHFTGMDPHVGQTLWLAVKEQTSGMEIGRVQATVESEFMVHIHGIENGMSYNVDFFADFNENGSYDAPLTDHAWRLELNDVAGDTTLNFAHNTSFTDIEWKHELTVDFSAMTPHVGQMLKLYVVNSASGSVVDSAMISSILSAEFELKSYSLMKGSSYYINFYADLNLSGSYDVPPVDHAWQLELNNVTGDTTLYFTHNTNFTDIFSATSVTDLEAGFFKFYPNPASDFVIIETGELNPENVSVSIYSITGKLNHVQKRSMHNKVEINVQGLKQGIYFLEIQTADQRKTMKLIKE